MIELWRVIKWWSWSAMGLAAVSLALWFAGSLVWNILTPFAALLTLVAGPLGLAMSRAARSNPKGPARIEARDAVFVFALAALVAGGESLASSALWGIPGLLFTPAAALACALGVAGLGWSLMAAKKTEP